MKKILIILAAIVGLSCGGNKSEQPSGEVNSAENVDENSGDNISPQLTDSADRLEVDTVNSASGVEAQKDKELSQ